MINKIHPFNFALPHKGLLFNTKISLGTVHIVYTLPANTRKAYLYQKDARVSDKYVFIPKTDRIRYSTGISCRNNNHLVINYFLYKFVLMSGNVDEYLSSISVQITKKDIKFLWDILTIYTYNAQKIQHRYVPKNLVLDSYTDKSLHILNEFILRLEKLFEEALPNQVFYAYLY